MVQELINKLKAADEDAQTKMLLQIIVQHQSQLVDANILQLYSGRNSQGLQLTPYRNPDYAVFKNRLNPLPGLGTPDFKLTGAFYAGMYADTGSFPIYINSTDSKTGLLAERDEAIFGLDEKSLSDFREEIRQDVQEYYKSIFQL